MSKLVYIAGPVAFSVFTFAYGNSSGSGPAPSAPVNVTPASIDIGDGLAGTTAVATPGIWDNADEVVGQWQRAGIDIPGETNLTYTQAEADAEQLILYYETATNAHGPTQASSNVETPQALSAPSNSVAPEAAYDGINATVISYGIWEGNPLPGDYTYQWSIDLNDGNGMNEIPGATLQTIVPGFFTPGIGMSLFCAVTAYSTFGGSTHQQGANTNALI